MKILVVLSIVALFISCASQQKESSWPEKMQGLGRNLSEVLPLIFNENKFKNPKNKKEILEKLEALRGASHNISQDNAKNLLGKDPLVEYSLKRLKSNMDESIELYKEGRTGLSQGMLKSSISYCFYCHTRSNFGPQFKKDHFKIDLSSIKSPLDRSQILIATRQYDKALEEISSDLFKEKDKSVFQDLRLLKHYIQIAIKSGLNERKIIKNLEKYEVMHSMPLFLQNTLKKWKSSLTQWQKWKHTSSYVNKKRANMRNSSLKLDLDNSFVDAIYLSENLHKKIMLQSKKKAELYYDLAQIYNLYPELQLWELAEIYFVSCIMEEPKSKIAKQCYLGLEESIYLGFSGSSGTHIPQSQKLRLKILRGKAGL